MNVSRPPAAADKQGRRFSRIEELVIAGKPPTVKVKLDRAHFIAAK